MREMSQLSLTRHTGLVFLMMMMMLDTRCCFGTTAENGTSSHTTKELLRDAIKEYNTIRKYLTRLLHAIETQRPLPTTNTIHYSTVKRIPYPIHIHPLLPYHPDFSPVSPAPSTTSTSSRPSSESIPLEVFTRVPTVSSKTIKTSLFLPTPVLLVHPSNVSSSLPTVHSATLATVSTTAVSPASSVTELSLVTQLFNTSTVTLVSSTPSYGFSNSSHSVTSFTSMPSVVHPQTHSSTFTSFLSSATSIIHPQTHSFTSTTRETHSVPAYSSVTHSPPVSTSESSSDIPSEFIDDRAKDTEKDYSRSDSRNGGRTEMSSKEPITLHADIEFDSTNVTEPTNTYMKEVALVDGEEINDGRRITFPSNYSDASEGKTSLWYEGSNARKHEDNESTGRMNKVGNEQEKEKKDDKQERSNHNEGAMSEIDKRSKDWSVAKGKTSEEKWSSSYRKEEEMEKQILAHKKIDEKRTAEEEEWREDTESSEESNETDKSKTRTWETDQGWLDIRTQHERERARTGMEEEDEGALQHNKKRRKFLHYNHRENEASNLLQTKRRGKQKHRDTPSSSSRQKTTHWEERHRDNDETESQQTREDKDTIDKDTKYTNTPVTENEEHDSNTSTPSYTSYKNKKHRRIKDKMRRLNDGAKIRKVRHVIPILSDTTTQSPPHLCNKTTPKNKQDLCVQLFSALVGIEEVIWEVEKNGVMREGIHALQEKGRALGKVVVKVEGGGSVFPIVQQQLFVSFLHRLDQTVMKAIHQVEAKLTQHPGGPSLVVLVALGVGGGLVVVVMVVTVALIVARRRQMQREEIYHKHICGEQIPIQSFLHTGRNNPSMREDELEPHHSETVLWSRSSHDLGGGGDGGGCSGSGGGGCSNTKEQKESSRLKTFNSTSASHSSDNSYLANTLSHTANRKTIQRDTTTQNNKG